MPNQVKQEVKQRRTQQMLELSRSSQHRFFERFLGQTTPVLWEQETSPGSGIYSGLTSNYIRVYARGEKPLRNQITAVKMLGFRNEALWADITNENHGQG